MVVVVLCKRIFFVPLIAEKFGRGVKARSVHNVIQQRIDFVAVQLVETDCVVVVDEFTYNARLTTVMQHVREDMLLVVIVAPTVYDIVADAFCERTVGISFEFFYVCKSKFRYAASSKSFR